MDEFVMLNAVVHSVEEPSWRQIGFSGATRALMEAHERE